MNILKTEKFPYLLTILFALIGWSLTHSVDRLINSPIIEYKLKKECSGNGRKLVSYEITNISRDRLFENIEFKLLCKRGCKGKFLQAKLKLPPPMDISEEVEMDDDYVKFSIPELHPDWKLLLTVEMSEDFNPTLHFSSKKSANDNKPIRLLRSSFETYLIKHELKIIIGLIVFWSLLIILYLVLIGGKNNSGSREAPCQSKNPKTEVGNA